MTKAVDEYYLLKGKLEEITWALEGSCNDIDCDRYMYKELLKKKYKPVLEHHFSCLSSLKREKEAVMRLLSMKKFKKFRHKLCTICKKKIDTLGEDYTIVSFTRPSEFKGQKVYQYKGISVHKKCKRKVLTPEGWEKT
ncbi:hypothetical protein HYV87_05255 [Candidatus Woesearchaeota archaeon]|nr:hypothetical protein [Candidatus Woesearchaeota archaeon]MBI2582505.1 hypothetical protein [Candidatus Woesearchaeota archaeon]